MNNKIWKIKNREEMYSDKELISLISNGQISGDDEIMCKEMRDFLAVKDTIYQFYIKENSDENI